MADQPSDPPDTEYLTTEHLRNDDTLPYRYNILDQWRKRCRSVEPSTLIAMVRQAEQNGYTNRARIAREVARERAILLP